MVKRVRTRKKAGPYTLEVFRENNSIDVYLDYNFDKYSCSATIDKNGLARCFEYDGGKSVVVAGYIQNFTNTDEYGYAINEDRWETLKIVPKRNRRSLEKRLKTSYSSVKFWE